MENSAGNVGSINVPFGTRLIIVLFTSLGFCYAVAYVKVEKHANASVAISNCATARLSIFRAVTESTSRGNCPRSKALTRRPAVFLFSISSLKSLSTFRLCWWYKGRSLEMDSKLDRLLMD